jgi:hypothetical protein
MNLSPGTRKAASVDMFGVSLAEHWRIQDGGPPADQSNFTLACWMSER